MDKLQLNKLLQNLCYGHKNGYRPDEIVAKDIQELIDLGADIEWTDNDDPTLLPSVRRFGLTALHIASDQALYVAVKCLIENGANVFARDNSGNTAYHRVSHPRTVPLCKNMGDYIRMIKYLIKNALEQDPIDGLSRILDLKVQ